MRHTRDEKPEISQVFQGISGWTMSGKFAVVLRPVWIWECLLGGSFPPFNGCDGRTQTLGSFQCPSSGFCSLFFFLFFGTALIYFSFLGFTLNKKLCNTNSEDVGSFYSGWMSYAAISFSVPEQDEMVFPCFIRFFLLFFFPRDNYFELEKWQREWGSRGKI